MSELRGDPFRGCPSRKGTTPNDLPCGKGFTDKSLQIKKQFKVEM